MPKKIHTNTHRTLYIKRIPRDTSCGISSVPLSRSSGETPKPLCCLSSGSVFWLLCFVGCFWLRKIPLREIEHTVLPGTASDYYVKNKTAVVLYYLGHPTGLQPGEQSSTSETQSETQSDSQSDTQSDYSTSEARSETDSSSSSYSEGDTECSTSTQSETQSEEQSYTSNSRDPSQEPEEGEEEYLPDTEGGDSKLFLGLLALVLLITLSLAALVWFLVRRTREANKEKRELSTSIISAEPWDASLLASARGNLPDWSEELLRSNYTEGDPEG